MPTITLHVLSPRDRAELEDFIVSAAGGENTLGVTTPPFSPTPTTKAELQALVVARGYPVASFLEVYDDLMVQGRIGEYREVAV